MIVQPLEDPPPDHQPHPEREYKQQRVHRRVDPRGPAIVPEHIDPQEPVADPDEDEGGSERRKCATEDRNHERGERVHRVKVSRFSALPSSSGERLKSGFIRSSWRFRPSTISARPTLSAQYIGPPR